MDPSEIVNSLLPLLQESVAGAFKSSGAGVFGKLREAKSIADYVRSAGEKYQDNAIIQQLIDGLLMDKDGIEINTSEVDLNKILRDAGQKSALLDELGESGQQIKAFIIGLVEHIAGAAGSGLFGTGQKVSAEEAAFITELKAQLGA